MKAKCVTAYRRASGSEAPTCKYPGSPPAMGGAGEVVQRRTSYGADRLRRCRRAELEESLSAAWYEYTREASSNSIRYPGTVVLGYTSHQLSGSPGRRLARPTGLRPDQLRLATANSSLLCEIRGSPGARVSAGASPFTGGVRAASGTRSGGCEGATTDGAGDVAPDGGSFSTTGGAQRGGRNQRSSKPETDGMVSSCLLVASSNADRPQIGSVHVAAALNARS